MEWDFFFFLFWLLSVQNADLEIIFTLKYCRVIVDLEFYNEKMLFPRLKMLFSEYLFLPWRGKNSNWNIFQQSKENTTR